MLSLLTNTAALSARSALASTQGALARTQREISTGLRVSSSQDDAAYFSIATTMRTRIGEVEALDEGLKVTSSILNVTSRALATITQLTQGIGADLVSAQQAGVDVSAVQSDIASKQAGIIAAAQAATFNGVNWLVTRVVGTDTDTYTGDIGATESFADSLGGNAQALGSYDDAVDDTTVQAATRALASSSTGQTQDSAGALFHVTSYVIGQNATTTFSGAYHTITSSGDPYGYRSLDVPLSVASEGSVVSAPEDFHPSELFATFSGTASRSVVFQYADGTYASSGAPVPSRSVPYLDARDDVLDETIPYTSTPANLLTMRIRTAADAANAIGVVGQALQNLSGSSSFIGGLQGLVDGEATSNAALIDAMKIGVGSLVDADMDRDSTRLAALQTQQQLGIQTLGIANSNSRVILQLFDLG